MDGTIVVGVDGSEHSVAALRWALREARLRHAELHVVHAWQQVAVAELAAAAVPFTSLDKLQQRAQATLDECLDRARPIGSVTVEPILVHGPAPSTLLAASVGADLLVVGARGGGAIAGRLLGSVSQQCAAHAHCPVAVIPAPPAADEVPVYRAEFADASAPRGAVAAT